MLKSRLHSSLQYAQAFGDFVAFLPNEGVFRSDEKAVRQHHLYFVENVIMPLLEESEHILMYGAKFSDADFGGAGKHVRSYFQKTGMGVQLHKREGWQALASYERYWLDAESIEIRRGGILCLMRSHRSLRSALKNCINHGFSNNPQAGMGKQAFGRAREWINHDAGHVCVYIESRSFSSLDVFATPPLIEDLLLVAAEAEMGAPMAEEKWDYEPQIHYEQVLEETRIDIARSGNRLLKK